MDREQEELQFLGFFGIFKESFKIISSWRKIFTQITLSIIIPLSFIFLAHIQISELLFSRIMHNEYALDHTREGTTRYEKLSDILASEWTAFILFKAAYFTFFLILSLLSTSAVVYTIACIYTAKDITFRKVMSVVPKVWKRLMVTFLWNFAIVFAYNIVCLLFFLVWIVLIGPSTIGLLVLLILLCLYFVGFVYISVVWHLASVVSVLEEVYGMQAMIKSKVLIQGKMGVCVAIFLVISSCFIAIELVFEKFVVLGRNSIPLGNRIGFGILSLFLLVLLILFGLVIQTVVYLVCKSYHHESIDKSALADHLEVYLGEYVPLKGKDVQLEQFYV